MHGSQLVSMALTFLQANINHSARAQDLLLQCLAERLIHVAVISEPYVVPPRSDWVGDLDGLVAISTQSPAQSPSLVGVARGRGYVAARLGQVVVVGVYHSRNRPIHELEVLLGEVGTLIGQSSPCPVVVLGDLNAKSMAWGSPLTDPRGGTVLEWLAEVGLCVVNCGTENTCVRQWGGSIIDITLATPDLACRIRDWQVLVDEETLSDHRYIRFSVFSTVTELVVRERLSEIGPRWALKRLNAEKLQEAALVEMWNGTSLEVDSVDLDLMADRLCEAMSRVCDAAMPRACASQPRRQVYWWTEEIAELRRCCVLRRRQYQRYRRRRRRETEVSESLYATYREAARALRVAIDEAKKQAWQELLDGLERDPWGRPYRWARQKLRPWAPPITASLQPAVLQRVVDGLFPGAPGADFTPPTVVATSAVHIEGEEEIPSISEGELGAAVLRMRAKNTAPGPDGIPGRAWALSLKHMGSTLKNLFDVCFREGRFPRQWKRGGLVLLRKEGRPADEPSGYRPIVLLDEAGKMLERIIAARLVNHLEMIGPDLAPNQFGFRRGRSTLDAISCVRDLSEQACSSGGVLLAVSLDIANAFNTLPWSTILEGMRYHRVPSYLFRLVGDYLSVREVVFPTKNGTGCSPMTRGVPQGSVLGPLLWNVGYDWVLRGANLRGVSLVCYADDTLVTARGETYREAAILITAGVATVVNRIRMLGLEVALHKSEAICFHGPRRAPPAGSTIVVSGTSIPIGTTLKYLGVVLDGRWRFEAHMRWLSPKLLGTAGALSRLLPNTRGGGGRCRRLYTAVVSSMALYGAPIWAGSLNREGTSALLAAQRVMAVRVCRGYRTLSHEVACVLAGLLPWDIEAEVLASAYMRKVQAREQDERPAPREVAHWRDSERLSAVITWGESLLVGSTRRGDSARRLIEAIQPVLGEWFQRRHGRLSFRLTQILSGHGCFGRYLYRVARREASPVCHQCSFAEDTAQHALEACPGGAEPRRSLIAVVGSDLSLSAIIAQMVDDERSWEAMASFCEIIVSEREAEERERERDRLSLPLRRARTRRRANRAHTPSPLRGPGALDAGAPNAPQR